MVRSSRILFFTVFFSFSGGSRGFWSGFRRTGLVVSRFSFLYFSVFLVFIWLGRKVAGGWG